MGLRASPGQCCSRCAPAALLCSPEMSFVGGTEIDARFQSKTHGDIAIIVAPVLRFKDIGFNARVTIDQLAQPQQIVEGFAPEVL